MRSFLCLLLTMLTPLAFAQTILNRSVELDTPSGTLHGSLMLPKSDQRLPVALLIAGSGPTDRNGNNPQMRNDSLKRLAQVLARNGIASLRYDKRGIAASQPSGPDERSLSVERYAEDAVAWSRQLKADPRFGALILIGHSEGALIASLAAQNAGADALVSISGSGRPLDALLLEQLQGKLPPPLLAYSQWLIAELKEGREHDDVPQPLLVLFRPSVQPYLISMFRQDPADAFASVKVPALIVQGMHDIQVAVEDAERLHAAKPDAKLLLVPGMNHVLRIVPADREQQLGSYNDPQLPLANALGNGIVEFIKRTLALSNAQSGR